MKFIFKYVFLINLFIAATLLYGFSSTSYANDSEEEEMSLDDLDNTENTQTVSHGSAHSSSSAMPFKFKLFFDLIMEYDLEESHFQFKKDHAHVVIELPVNDNLHFRSDIAFEPEFYEVSYTFGQSLELTAGKVLIPFGQNEFHHLIGGRVDEHNLFLPDVWADYGIRIKHKVLDQGWGGFDYSLWVVNGFSGTEEPLMGMTSSSDNNNMKGFGIRPALRLGTTITIGANFYLDAWDKKARQQMLFYGADLDLGYGFLSFSVLRNLKIRAEFAYGLIQISDEINKLSGLIKHGYKKSGFNIEVTYKILNWLLFRYREGLLNPDNRYENSDDLSIHEPVLIAILGPVHIHAGAQIHSVLSKENSSVRKSESDNSTIFTRLFFRY